MNFLFSLLGLLPGFTDGLFKWLNAKTDAALEKFKAATGLSRDAALELLRTDAIVKQATANVILAAMNHPIWWAAWIMFVTPVAVYQGMIFFVSTFDMWLNTPGCVVPKMGDLLPAGRRLCEYFVRRVPEEQEQMARIILQSIFLAQVGTGATAGIASAITQRLNRPER